MNKLLTKIVGAALGVAMTVGVGVAVASQNNGVAKANAAQEVYYTLAPVSTGSNSSPHNSYTAAATTTISGVGWSATGNTNLVPWRIGGKSISGVDRDVHSTTALGSAITKVELTLGAASSCTVNSVALSVGSAESGSNIDVVTKNSGSLYNTTLVFEPSTGTEWATGSYYTFTLNVTVSGTSNKFVEFSGADFYRNASASSKYTVTYDLNGGTGTSNIPEDNNEYSNGATVTVLGIGDVTKSGYSFVNWSDGENTFDAGDTFEISKNTTLTAQWYHDDVISVVSGKEENTLYNGATLNLSNCVTSVGDGALSFNVPSVNYLTYDSTTTTVTADLTNTGGPLTITAYKGTAHCSFTVTVAARPATGTFNLFEDALEEGDYVVCSGTNAMSNTATSAPRIESETVIVSNDSIINPSSSVVWHIAKDGDYWTFYNSDIEKYAVFTSSDGKATFNDTITDYARFTVSGSYDFLNKQKNTKYLRFNAGYGFASYGTSTGVTLTLYKKAGPVVAAASVSVEAADTTSSLSLVKGSSGTIASILSATVYGSDGTTLATNQKVSWSSEDAAGVITFDNSEKTYSVTGAFNATAKIYATSEDGSIKSSNYVTITVVKPSMPYTLIPGTNGYSDSAETTPIVWTNSTSYTSIYYLDVHFSMAGTGSTGQYNEGSKTWRMYQTGNSTITITVPLGQTIETLKFTYDVQNGGILKDSSSATVASATNWSPASETQSATFSIGQTGSATNGQVQFKSIAVSFKAATLPSVTIDEPSGEIVKDDTGTFSAQTAHATNPSLTWTSNNSSIIRIDNASTGAFTATGYGVTTVSVAMTCTEGSANDTLEISVNAGLISISKAREICSALADNVQTTYKVTVSGFIIDFDADERGSGNERALNISSEKLGTSGSELEIFGIYSSNDLRKYAVLNGTVSYTGYLKHYGDTLELVSPSLVSYTDDAIEFARNSYNSLSATCSSQGAAGITNEQWNSLSSAWNSVDSYSKTKLREATSEYQYSEDIAKWIQRYTIIVEYGRTDFMGLGISNSRNITPAKVNSTNSAAIIAIVSVISLSAVAGFFLLRKRKEQ